MTPDIAALQARIGYAFKDPLKLELALTHPSWLQDNPAAGGNNQRLEFLGDSVLQLILTEALYALFPEDREGELTKRRAILGKGQFLATLAKDVGLDRCLILGVNEEQNGGRSRSAALEDAFEAMIGAINLDGGFDAARRTVLGIYGDLGGRIAAMESHANPKGRLQEIVQPEHGNNALRYDLITTEGADHEKVYEVGVHLQGRHLGTGRGSSKRVAEEEAARAALKVIGTQPPGQ